MDLKQCVYQCAVCNEPDNMYHSTVTIAPEAMCGSRYRPYCTRYNVFIIVRSLLQQTQCITLPPVVYPIQGLYHGTAFIAPDILIRFPSLIHQIKCFTVQSLLHQIKYVYHRTVTSAKDKICVTVSALLQSIQYVYHITVPIAPDTMCISLHQNFCRI